MACDIWLERSRGAIQLFFRPHLNRRSAHKIMGPQSKVVGDPTLAILGFPFGRPGTKCHLDVGLVYNILYGGRWWLPPSPGHDESCEFELARGSSYHQKCSINALINLLFGLCRSMWVNKCLSFFLITSWSSNTPLYPPPPKCCELGSVP